MPIVKQYKFEQIDMIHAIFERAEPVKRFRPFAVRRKGTINR